MDILCHSVTRHRDLRRALFIVNGALEKVGMTYRPRYARHADRTVHHFDGRVVKESVEAG